MLHTIYALFDEPSDAALSKAALEKSGAEKHHFSVVVHSKRLHNVPTAELKLFETSAVEGGVFGASLGGVLGAALGLAVLGPFGLVGGGAIAALIFGTTASTLVGTLTGVVAGSAAPDPIFEKLAKAIEDGKVLLSVDCKTLTDAENAEAILQAHHAVTVHRHAFRPLTEAERTAIDGKLEPKSP